MRAALIIAVCALAVFARRADYKPDNSIILFEDSVWIDSTETKYLPMFWQDDVANKAILVEARDDSSTGFASDSYSVRIDVYQAFPLNTILKNNNQYPYIVNLPSRAHPDSSTYPYGTDFQLFDSLDILDMDTNCVYARDSIPTTNIAGDTIGYTFGDSLRSSTLSNTGFGGFAYRTVSFDYTPGLSFKITGLLRNRKKGVGSLTRIKVYALKGTVVEEK